MTFISARNPEKLKAAASITATHEVLERGMEYLYEKKIAFAAQTISRQAPEIDEASARTRAQRMVRETFIRPWNTISSNAGNAGQRTWAIAQDHLPELITYIENEKHFKSSNNSVFLKRHGIGSYPHLVDAALAQLHREQLELWTHKLGNDLEARYYVEEHICRRFPASHDTMVWHIHDGSVDLLKELIKRPSPWIKSNQRERLVAHGITPKKDIIHRCLPDYFERLIEQEMADYETQTGQEMSHEQAQQRVEATKLRRTDELRFAGEGWEIHEHFILQLARDVPEIRAKGKQDWVSLSETGHVILQLIPEIKTISIPDKFEWLHQQAEAFFHKKIAHTKRTMKFDDDDAIGEVERSCLFKDDSHSQTVWSIRKEVVPEFRDFMLDQLRQHELSKGPFPQEVTSAARG